jgi:signal transduction histidine kinase
MHTRGMSWLTQDRPAFIRYGVAVLSLPLTVGLIGLFDRYTGQLFLFIGTTAALLVSVLGGYGPGILATLATAIALKVLVLEPTLGWTWGTAEIIRYGVYIAVGLIVSYLGASLNTAVRLLQRARFHAEDAIRARDEFISVTCHELKTPITSLKLQTQMGKRSLSRSAEQVVPRGVYEKFLVATEQGLKRMQLLIDDLQDYARIMHNRLKINVEEIDLKTVIGGIRERLADEAKEAGSPLKVSVPESIVGRWDPVRIDQLLSNLVTNAIKYGEGKPIEVGAEKRNGHALAYVKDNGPGVATENREKIFGRFERISDSAAITGLGLGLFITRRIAELHGGRIWVEGNEGGGASFFVELPLTGPALQSMGSPTAK